jgi:LysM repeat protein
MRRQVAVLFLILTGCSSRYFEDDGQLRAKMAIDGVRQEVADLKHELRSTQVTLQILEEKCQEQENALTGLKTKNPKFDQLASQISLLERKIAQGETFQEKVLSDLRGLSTHLQQSTGRIQECEKEVAFQKTRLDEVTRLKTTLHSISQAIQQKPKAGGNQHVVKSGETLEKIARQHNVTVTALKKHNHLNSDRIQIGQEIDIPND